MRGYTSINLPDSLRDGRSHFMAEVLLLRSSTKAGKKKCLVILDEMFRDIAKDAFLPGK
ncbi:MAG: hypothetical protein ACLUDY_12720 [Bacteroides xylanisolvens]